MDEYLAYQYLPFLPTEDAYSPRKEMLMSKKKDLPT